jgi:hypothetical protein
MSIQEMINKRVNDEILRLDSAMQAKPETDKQGMAFMMYALRHIFKNFNDDEIEEGIVDSNYRNEQHDYGIDAIYVTANHDALSSADELDDYNKDTKFAFHILQFKKGDGLDLATLLKLKDGIKKAFIDNKVSKSQNEYMFNRMQEIVAIRSKMYEQYSATQIKVKIYLCFTGVRDTVLTDSIVAPHLADIKQVLIDNHYGTEAIEVNGAQDLLEYERRKPGIIAVVKYKKAFKYITETSGADKLNGYICILQTREIGRLVKEYQKELFERNIREFYKNNLINTKILETACSIEESKYFWSFNNGLTITCSKIEELPEDQYRIYDLQIVNGCQTSNALYQGYAKLESYNELVQKQELTADEQKELETLTKEKLDEGSTILIKIIETEDDDLIYKITETTNSQTPVKVFNIKANEDIHKNIDQFFLDHGIYYERRANYYKNQKKSPIVDMKELSQLYLSVIKFKPSQARSKPAAMFITYYDQVFPDPDVSQINYKLYLLPVQIYFKVSKSIRNIRRIKSETDEYKVALMAYGRLHLCSFLLHAILGAQYNEKGIIKNFVNIANILGDDAKFAKYFSIALNNFKKVMTSYAGSQKESIYEAIRNAELDSKIVRFVHKKK